MSFEMTCNDAREAMLSHLDAPEESLDQHLAACPRCADQWQILSSSWGARDSLRAPQAPALLQQRVLAELENRRILRPRSTLFAGALPWLGRGVAAGAAVSYAILGLWLAWSWHTRPADVSSLSPPVARAWARMPDLRSRAWLLRELGPADRPPDRTSDVEAGRVAAREKGRCQ